MLEATTVFKQHGLDIRRAKKYGDIHGFSVSCQRISRNGMFESVKGLKKEEGKSSPWTHLRSKGRVIFLLNT